MDEPEKVMCVRECIRVCVKTRDPKLRTKRELIDV